MPRRGRAVCRPIGSDRKGTCRAKDISVAAASLAAAVLPASAQVKIGVIASSTGPISVIGVQQKNTAALLPKQIGNLTVDYIYMDDNSDPTQSTKNVQKMLIEDKVDAVVGPFWLAERHGSAALRCRCKDPDARAVGTTAVILPVDDKNAGCSRRRRTTIW